MSIKLIFPFFEEYQEKEAIIWQDQVYSYAWLKKAVEEQIEYLASQAIQSGMVVVLETDFSPHAVAVLLALIAMKTIIVPLSQVSAIKRDECQNISEASVYIKLGAKRDDIVCKKTCVFLKHPLLVELQQKKTAGIILFSSGSTGASKAAVHDFELLVKKFSKKRHQVRGVAFLLFDHIGGLNTLFYSLYNGGCLIIPLDRSPAQVSAAIAKYKVEALTTTPTFLNLLLLSKVYELYDLSCLKWINYSTEVMPSHTLKKLNELLPKTRLSQAYGLSELGVLATQSKASDSLFIKLTQEDYKIRIIDGLLEVKSSTSMKGYLNAPTSLTEDGWFKTGDAVEVEGEYLRILGRQSEIINVGGRKVYPAEVENIIQSMPGVEDVVVIAEKNILTGQMVKAAVKLSSEEKLSEFRERLHTFCIDKLEPYKIPQKVTFLDKVSYTARFKKMRKIVDSTYEDRF